METRTTDPTRRPQQLRNFGRGDARANLWNQGTSGGNHAPNPRTTFGFGRGQPDRFERACIDLKRWHTFSWGESVTAFEFGRIVEFLPDGIFQGKPSWVANSTRGQEVTNCRDIG